MIQLANRVPLRNPMAVVRYLPSILLASRGGFVVVYLPTSLVEETMECRSTALCCPLSLTTSFTFFMQLLCSHYLDLADHATYKGT